MQSWLHEQGVEYDERDIEKAYKGVLAAGRQRDKRKRDKEAWEIGGRIGPQPATLAKRLQRRERGAETSGDAENLRKLEAALAQPEVQEYADQQYTKDVHHDLFDLDELFEEYDRAACDGPMEELEAALYRAFDPLAADRDMLAAQRIQAHAHGKAARQLRKLAIASVIRAQVAWRRHAAMGAYARALDEVRAHYFAIPRALVAPRLAGVAPASTPPEPAFAFAYHTNCGRTADPNHYPRTGNDQGGRVGSCGGGSQLTGLRALRRRECPLVRPRPQPCRILHYGGRQWHGAT